MSAVAVLAMLISKILQKARELSARLFHTEPIQPQMPVQEHVRQSPEKKTVDYQQQRMVKNKDRGAR